MQSMEQARHNMVENQLRPSHIDDPRVLEAMGSVEREAFLPVSLKSIAYGDDDIDLGGGRFLIEPLALAKMIQTAGIKPDDVALVIGCSTGYVPAVVCRLCATTFMLADDPANAEKLDANLAKLNCDNVIIETGVVSEGLPKQAPFDVIIAAGALGAIPHDWQSQLSDNGRMSAIVRHGGFGKVTLVTRLSHGFDVIEPFDASIPYLKIETGEEEFVF